VMCVSILNPSPSIYRQGGLELGGVSFLVLHLEGVSQGHPEGIFASPSNTTFRRSPGYDTWKLRSVGPNMRSADTGID
jgi:hypothetical protein